MQTQFSTSVTALATDHPTHHLWDGTIPRRGPVLRSLGAAVREQRARCGISQEEFGFRAGLHRNYVGAIERGDINPTFRVLVKVTKGTGRPLSELVALYERNLRERMGALPPRRAGHPFT